MSDASALLSAIAGYPDDDVPRKMFADWCEENGQPQRAEFVRLQLGLVPPDPLWPPTFRADTLLSMYKGEWVKGPACTACSGWGFGGGGRGAACARCSMTGEVGGLTWRVIPDVMPLGGIYDMNAASATFARGFPNAVFCRLRDAWRDGAPTAWAQAVVRHHPVTEFGATDKFPDRDGSVRLKDPEAEYGFDWNFDFGDVAPASVGYESVLPVDVFDAVTADLEYRYGQDSFCEFRTPLQACDALARAVGRLVRGHVYKGG